MYCFKCNKSNHNKCNFKFKTSKYRTCQLIGHIEKMCYIATETKPWNFTKEIKTTRFVKQKQLHVNESEVKNLVPLHILKIENIAIKEEFPNNLHNSYY